MPGLLLVRRQTFLNVRVVTSRLVLRTPWGSIVYFQVEFLDTFRHSMQATGGKIRQNKA
jgi:threonine aldolase